MPDFFSNSKINWLMIFRSMETSLSLLRVDMTWSSQMARSAEEPTWNSCNRALYLTWFAFFVLICSWHSAWLITVLSRGVRSLFGPIRKSSPWGNFSDDGLNHSIKRQTLHCKPFSVIDWLINDESTLTWLVYWTSYRTICFYGGGGLKWPNITGQ